MSFEEVAASISKFYQGERAQSSLLGITGRDFTDLGEVKESEQVGVSGISQLDEINELAMFTERDCSQLSMISRDFMVNKSKE
jgi:hypothetical protein|tara:strand:- start:280 stop:528 length:249 start_codon:yes stop_codon:yes gene_type:complete